MAKKNTPIITHTEIVCLAIEALDAKVRKLDEIVERAAEKGKAVQDMAMEMREQSLANLGPKLQALKDLYKIETGADYN